MTVEDFLNEFKSRDFALFEKRTVLKILKGCESETRAAFFSSAPQIDGVSHEWKSAAVYLVAYTIGMSGNNIFSKISGIHELPSSGDLLCGKRALWQDVLRMFVNEIDSSLDVAFWTSFYQETTTVQFIQQSCMQFQMKPQFVPLFFELIRLYLPERFDDYCDMWKVYTTEAVMSLFTHRPYLDDYNSYERIRDGIRIDVQNAMECQTNSSNRNDYEYSDRIVFTSSRQTITIHERRLKSTHSYDVGAAVRDWLNADSIKRCLPGLGSVSNVHFDDVSYSGWEKDTGSPSGCVTGTTRISLPDGSALPITAIQPGCEILSEGGRISVTSDEFIINTEIHALYGINEMEPFLSLEHAVRTLDGWKSLNPLASNTINPHFQVTELKVGDTVVMQDGLMKIKQLNIIEAPEGTAFTGYDLHLRQGYSSYFANGLLVLLNYPELTMTRIKRNMEKMQREDADLFSRLVTEHQSLFAQVFGTAAINCFLLNKDGTEREGTSNDRNEKGI